jgi:hypothetical protein
LSTIDRVPACDGKKVLDLFSNQEYEKTNRDENYLPESLTRNAWAWLGIGFVSYVSLFFFLDER